MNSRKYINSTIANEILQQIKPYIIKHKIDFADNELINEWIEDECKEMQEKMPKFRYLTYEEIDLITLSLIKKNLKRKAIATEIGISPVTFDGYMNQTKAISQERLQAIIDALDLNNPDLIKWYRS